MKTRDTAIFHHCHHLFWWKTIDNWAIQPIYEHAEETTQLQKILADIYRKMKFTKIIMKMIVADYFAAKSIENFDKFYPKFLSFDQAASLEISLDQKQQFDINFEFF